MKYTEFHRRITKNGWKFSHAEGSHYFYMKGGILSEPVPYHGAKEIPEPLRKKSQETWGLNKPRVSNLYMNDNIKEH